MVDSRNIVLETSERDLGSFHTPHVRLETGRRSRPLTLPASGRDPAAGWWFSVSGVGCSVMSAPSWWLLDEGEAPGFFKLIPEDGMPLRPLRPLRPSSLQSLGPWQDLLWWRNLWNCSSLQSTGASAGWFYNRGCNCLSGGWLSLYSCVFLNLTIISGLLFLQSFWQDEFLCLFMTCCWLV